MVPFDSANSRFQTKPSLGIVAGRSLMKLILKQIDAAAGRFDCVFALLQPLSCPPTLVTRCSVCLGQ
eukprot:scaffold45195_cov78-Cyclotella_meneghiniana.AAC.6